MKTTGLRIFITVEKLENVLEGGESGKRVFKAAFPEGQWFNIDVGTLGQIVYMVLANEQDYLDTPYTRRAELIIRMYLDKIAAYL